MGWITFKGGQCISDQQLDERLKYALDEILKVSPSELMEISSSEDIDIPEHIGMGILEVKMQLKFIRMLRGGEKEYQGCMEKEKTRVARLKPKKCSMASYGCGKNTSRRTAVGYH